MGKFVATVEPPWDSDTWRAQARAALRAAIAPDAIEWRGGNQPGLLDAPEVAAQPPSRPPPAVSKAFMSLIGTVLCHRDAQRHGLLYRILWRMAEGEPALLERATDVDVHRAMAMAQAVRRDAHKMKAFVRFREVPGETDAFVAWFEPAHHIVDRVAPFFARRFAGMRWTILTPERSVRWDGAQLSYGAGGFRSEAPADDAQEDLWRTYYANIFNPARLKLDMMRAEMPQKYWKHLPETHLLPTLISEAGKRVHDMTSRAPQAPRRRIPQAPTPRALLPEDGLEALRHAARDCRRCPLWQPATQTVFGEGPQQARVVIVGEQPGDQEDLRGRPFVGPAGKLLDRVLSELGVDRSQLYLTNAVKHFRFERRGKMRLHRNPEASHVTACATWLWGELDRIRPDVVVCLGATAAQALFGRGFRLMEERGSWLTLPNGARAMATVHPSWILRQANPTERESAYQLLLRDLHLACIEGLR